VKGQKLENQIPFFWLFTFAFWFFFIAPVKRFDDEKINEQHDEAENKKQNKNPEKRRHNL
jgi:hypothetical protein